MAMQKKKIKNVIVHTREKRDDQFECSMLIRRAIVVDVIWRSLSGPSDTSRYRWRIKQRDKFRRTIITYHDSGVIFLVETMR